MVPKRATFMTYGADEKCADIKKFIEDAGVLLDIWDIEKKPLTVRDIESLVGHLDLNHFLNPLSRSFEKHGLDKDLPPRDEVIKLIAEDHTLLRRPIIRNNRLFTIGCDKRKIAEMLQISPNGKSSADDEKDNGQANKKEAAGASKS